MNRPPPPLHLSPVYNPKKITYNKTNNTTSLTSGVTVIGGVVLILATRRSYFHILDQSAYQ